MGDDLRVGGASTARLELATSDTELRASRLSSRLGTAIGDLQRGRGSLEDAEALLNETSEVLAALTREARAGGTIDRLGALRETLATAVQTERREREVGAVAERRGASGGSELARDVARAAQAMRRSGDPSSFAGILVRGGSDARMRELSRTSESELRAALGRAGVTGENADRAIEALKANIALPFERRVHQQAARRLDQSVERFERASIGMGPELEAQLERLQGPRGDEMLTSLRLVGLDAEADELEAVLRQGGDDVGERLRLPLARAMRGLAEVVRERATNVAQGEGASPLTAGSSREFPWAAAEVEQRWGAGGIVADAIREHVDAANAERAHDTSVGKAILMVAGVVATVTAASSLGGTLNTAAREALEAGSIWEQADDTATDAAAGLESVELAQQAKRRAAVAVMGATGAVVIEGAAGAAVHAAHHDIVHNPRVLPDVVIDGLIIAAEAAIAVGVEVEKHRKEELLGEAH
jgi:hypothetical protein